MRGLKRFVRNGLIGLLALALLFPFFLLALITLPLLLLLAGVAVLTPAVRKKISKGIPKWNSKKFNGTAKKLANKHILPKLYPATTRVMSHYDFIVYFDGPLGATYQVKMWDPFFSRLGGSYVIATRELPNHIDLVRSGYNSMFVKTLSVVDQLSRSGAKTVFYTNNSVKNSQMVRHRHLTHVQLLHGDSDKPSSFNPVTTMFDIVGVAGQLGIDRYLNNGVPILPEKFRIISRPQCGELGVATEPTKVIKTVFYATTWRDHNNGDDAGSIENAYHAVQQLVENGYRVIFRPHPYSMKSSVDKATIERICEFFDNSEADVGFYCGIAGKKNGLMTIAECINESDAMLSDVTSVLSDWLYSNKPYFIIDPLNDHAALIAQNPVVRAAYYVDREMSQLAKPLGEISKGDHLFDERVRLRKYVLGVDLDESPVDLFVSTMKDVMQNYDKDAVAAERIKKEYGNRSIEASI
ncbi:MAG: CDP-glycerol glycerophosphotransferase family protein [Devosia sp.]|uniref:CDP-glycerol glycerophosphotransferase family protein n=1 Tax=Devosia sp. TaxID=1871048 RepID=UPI0024CA7CF5|nr:CDP-glycerol glycerophosphotransferase family protein [Devosia sp.]UYO00440.1 MAG: CDP-glycerol glycerophosphotransferase family protein [Devosia sp.]